MSITDELRKWKSKMQTRRTPEEVLALRAELDCIADRIDAKYQKAMDEWKARDGQMWLKGYSECRAEIAEGNDAIARDLEANGWVRLPLDADGVPIRVGDVMEVKFNTKRRPFTVSFVGERAVAFWVVGQPDLKSFNLDTVLVTHHHEPTVEDVLRKCIANVCRSNTQLYEQGCPPLTMEDIDSELDEYIAEYAKRLRLAEGVDE